jgi:uncharacterized protein (TIGR03083 family)
VVEVESIPRIDHREAMPIAAREYDLFLALLRYLDGDDWSRQTDNDEWDVRATALHVLGATASNASFKELAHQMRHGRKLYREIGSQRHWHHWVDGVNEVQVRERASMSNAELVETFATTAPAAVRGRTKLPRPLRALRVIDLPEPYTHRMPLLTDVCYTRDTWMHRVDMAVATGRAVAVSAEHDGRLIADMVAEWATLYTFPFDLELTGPAGGRYRKGTGGEYTVVDAVECIRILSGRAPGSGLLSHPMPL